MNEKKSFKLIGVYLTIVLALIGWGVSSLCRSCSKPKETKDTLVTEKRDTLYIEVHDTLPIVKSEKVVKYIKVPVYSTDTIIKVDSMDVPIVQKEYSDDSTYKAYVSGVMYEELPKLDSIIVRQREVTHTIERTITVETTHKPLFSYGLQVGLGYGILSKKIEPYVGFGGQINF